MRRGGCWEYHLCAPPPLASDSRWRPCADLEKKESLELQPTQEPTAFRLALGAAQRERQAFGRSGAEAKSPARRVGAHWPGPDDPPK